LRGDPSDNIPGVTGIGEKTAIELISKFGTLDNLYKEIEDNTPLASGVKTRIKELLIKYKEQAFLSKELVEIEVNVPIELDMKECLWGGYDKGKAEQLLKDFEFFSLINRLP